MREVVENHYYHPSCWKRIADQNKQIYKERVRNGLCVRCGKQLHFLSRLVGEKEHPICKTSGD
jgi:hypothetical protein